MLSPVIGKGDDTLADKVRSLVADLDGRSAAARIKAEARLIALGTPALAHLPKSTRRLSPEARDRLARIRKRLEQQEAKESIEPTRITLDHDEAPLSDVLEKIVDETANRVYLPGGGGPEVSASFSKTPYWQAMDQLLDQAEMTIYPFADEKGYRVEPRVGSLRPRTKRATYSDAFRFEPTMLDFRHDFRTTDSGTLHLKLQAAWEPRLAPIAIGLKPKSLKAVDNKGDVVTVDSATSGSAAAVRPGTMAAEMDIVLVPPPRSAKSIATLSGNIGVLMPTRRVRFEFDALDSDKARRERIGAISVMLSEVRKIDDLWRIGIAAQFNDAASGLESHLDWESKDRAVLLAPGGKTISPARREMQKQGDEVRWSYWFRAPGKIADYRLVYDVPSDIVEIEVPFEIKDLPLP